MGALSKRSSFDFLDIRKVLAVTLGVVLHKIFRVMGLQLLLCAMPAMIRITDKFMQGCRKAKLKGKKKFLVINRLLLLRPKYWNTSNSTLEVHLQKGKRIRERTNEKA
jgi:hypothetical protein